MRLNKLFQLDYPKVLIFLAGVIIGLTPALNLLWIKISYLIIAILLIILAMYVRKKDSEVKQDGILGEI